MQYLLDVFLDVAVKGETFISAAALQYLRAQQKIIVDGKLFRSKSGLLCSIIVPTLLIKYKDTK